MAYRDTLFSTKRIWWVLCGQSQLYNLLEATDRRISQRIRGPGIEIPPMTGKELSELVARRIKRYKSNDQAKCPLSDHIHDQLFRASRGVARFVLHTADTLTNMLVEDVRHSVRRTIGRQASHEVVDEMLDEKLNNCLFARHIADRVAEAKLAQMSAESLAGKGLLEGEIAKLSLIGNRDVTAEQYIEFGFSSAKQFQEAFLEKMTNSGFLQRRSIQLREEYRLRDFAYLCADLRAFDQARHLVKTRE